MRDFEIQGTVHNPLFSIELTNIFHESTDSVGPHIYIFGGMSQWKVGRHGTLYRNVFDLDVEVSKGEPVESIIKSAREKDRIVACSISACGYSFITTTHAKSDHMAQILCNKMDALARARLLQVHSVQLTIMPQLRARVLLSGSSKVCVFYLI